MDKIQEKQLLKKIDEAILELKKVKEFLKVIVKELFDDE